MAWHAYCRSMHVVVLAHPQKSSRLAKEIIYSDARPKPSESVWQRNQAMPMAAIITLCVCEIRKEVCAGARRNQAAREKPVSSGLLARRVIENGGPAPWLVGELKAAVDNQCGVGGVEGEASAAARGDNSKQRCQLPKMCASRSAAIKK